MRSVSSWVDLMGDGTPSPRGYHVGHFDTINKLEDRHYWFRVRTAIIVSAVRRLALRLAPGYGVLEVGCGTGHVLRALARTCTRGQVYGLEPFSEGAALARQRVGCTVAVGELRDHPFDRAFDIVGLFDVIEQVDDDVDLLARAGALLRPAGRVVVTVPAHPALWSDFDIASGHRRRYSTVMLERSLTRAGLRTEYLTPIMSLLYPMAWVGRRSRGVGERPVRSAEEVVAHELRLPPAPLNQLAFWALRAEAVLVAHQWRLPWGTSLLAVARRADPNES